MIKGIILGVAALLFVGAVSIARGQTASPTTTPTLSPTTSVSPTPTQSIGGTTIPGGAPSTGFGR